MVWRAVQEATGFNALEHTKNSDADDAFNPVSTTQTNFHENPDEMTGELEARRQLLHRLMRLTPNLAEQTALGMFAGGDDTEASIVFQSGNQILQQKKPALMPTPTGPLMQRFAQIFLDATEEDDEGIHRFVSMLMTSKPTFSRVDGTSTWASTPSTCQVWGPRSSLSVANSIIAVWFKFQARVDSSRSSCSK